MSSIQGGSYEPTQPKLSLNSVCVNPARSGAPSCSNPPHKVTGFTLIEMMITVVILAIITALAVPSFTGFVRDNRRASTINQFVAGLSLARSEAVNRGNSAQPIVLCKSNTGTSCTPGSSWADGWILFVNVDADSPAVVDVGERILRVNQVSRPLLQITPTLSFTNFVPYLADGSAGNQFGTFTYCDARGASKARAVIINRAGRPRLSRDSDGNGIHEGGAGDLVCP